MKRPGRIFPIHAAAFLVLSLCALSLPSSIHPQETRRTETVAPGIEYLTIQRSDFARRRDPDRWMIHVLLLDPRRTTCRLGRALDNGVGIETTRSIAARHGALAAVNGGYYRTTGIYRGEPAGLLSLSGKVLSEPYRKRPALAVKEDGAGIRIHFGHFDFTAEVLVEGGERRLINGINRPRLDDELILYTPEFHSTTLTNAYGIEAVIIDGVVTSRRDGVGSQSIPRSGCILSANGRAQEWASRHLHPGARLEIRTEMAAEPPLTFDPDFILGGGPILLRGGMPAAADDPGLYAEDFRRNRHPRTAIGVRKDGGLVIVAVDGRQPGLSDGMTIDEIASLMAELGCVEALNLDGGGSTTMVIKNKVVNSPSDPTGERSVGNALLFFLR